MESLKISSINPFFSNNYAEQSKMDAWFVAINVHVIIVTLLPIEPLSWNDHRWSCTFETVRNIIKARHLLNKERYLTRCHLFTLNYSFCKCFLFFIGRYLIVRFLSSYSRLSFLFYFAFLFEQLEGFGVEISFTLSFRLKGEQW